MATVEYQQASRIYDPSRPPAVNRISLTVADGEFLVLVGPSGSGKSTAMRMLAGLEPIDEGSVHIDDVDVSEMRARDRDVAMVFQSYALYPNMTARQNMAFALQNLKLPSAEIDAQVKRAAAMLELEPLLDKKPSQMSGGQRQRVAMGRSIVRNPKVFCMDEPLSNLDAKLRVSTRAQIGELQRELGVTTVYVTHDQTEAMTMGDRVAVLRDGVLQQVDEPTHLYDHPGNTFVATFIGSPAMTLLDGARIDAEGRARLADGHGPALPLPRELRARADDEVIVGVRPENWEIAAVGENAGSADTIPLRVRLVERLGGEAHVHCRPLEGETVGASVRGGQVVMRLVTGFRELEAEMVVHVRPTPGSCTFFHPESEINLEYL
ncbi:ABC transporter ATP-binding protein [Brachybacterium saurashtrense]|uniref:ATP-binding cassette domain-containing protein n=1 Tax=Brachybacterium saurashtrense TaxID=556288 RepID=A0A345YSS2_9MICO|nr:ATP-binding cassette domain-containing protein [Brachybacterium saurashtrense]AXK46974.1 ATP-binding cassette domain-containing protein [Brachybacterium saurashtrense]RRR22689.1 ATP-binding cassette domain-containing protein [Brachybacterium saurashtrense]